MSNEHSKRKHPRFRAALNVAVSTRDWDDVHTLSTLNISRGGMFIRCSHPVSVGATLSISVRLPDGSTLEATGIAMHCVNVVRAEQQGIEAGVGVRFDEKHAIDLDLLEVIAASHSGGRSGSYSLDDLDLPAMVSVPGSSLAEQTSARVLDDVGADSDDSPRPARDASEREGSSASDERAPAESVARAVAARHERPSRTPTSAEYRVVDVDALAPRPDPVASPVDDQQPLQLEGALPSADAHAMPLEGALPLDDEQAHGADSLDIAIDVDLDLEDERDEPSERSAPAMIRRRQVDVPGGAIFGVDFGTSYSGIAVATQSEVSMLLDAEDHTMVPSTVCYLDDGSPLVGWEARVKMITQPTTAVSSCKRFIGRQYDDAEVQPYLSQLAPPTSAGPDGEIMLSIYGEPVSLLDVAREIFAYLSQIARETTTADVVRQVVLSAPVGFGRVQRGAIEQAALRAGLKPVECLDEPVAAAIAHGLGEDDATLVVYDFGGGTFDCTVMRTHGGSFEVLGRGGDAWLGGDDFDIVLAEYAADEFWRQTKVDVRKRQVEWRRLLQHCEAAKRKLSAQQTCTLSVPGMLLSISGPVDLELELSRDLIGQLCRDLVDRSLTTMDACLEKAGVDVNAVDHVVMVGGVARMPLVRDLVRTYFQREVRLGVDPEHAVVLGNAIYGLMLVRGQLQAR